jgi:hypothetical protein
MPYKRVGKCVHKKYSNKKISKKPIGCSDSIEKAKDYIQALYANEMNEGKKMTSKEIAKREDIIKGMLDNKRSLVKKYGADAEKVMYGTATSKAKKIAEMESNDKLREIIKKALSKPVEEEKTEKFDNNPALKGNQKDNLPDALQKAIIKKKGGTVEEGDLDLGHQDDEPGMLKANIYDIGKYAVELYKMVSEFDKMEGEVDFPHWWQSKIIKAKEFMSSAKHYLEFEVNEPKIDAAVDMMVTEEESEDPGELMVGSYQTKFFDMCPAAQALYQDIESKVEDMNLAERTAKLQDALFAIEKHVINDEETGSDEVYMTTAQNLADQIMEMAKMMGLENEHNYIQGHVDRIASELKKGIEDGLMETIKELKKSNPNATSKEITEQIQEIKILSEKKDSLCKRGKDYIKARKAAGEKSSAYLSGRAVKVCKGDIKFKGKKVDSYK